MAKAKTLSTTKTTTKAKNGKNLLQMPDSANGSNNGFRTIPCRSLRSKSVAPTNSTRAAGMHAGAGRARLVRR
jgi:hypothetical protein